MKYLVNSVRLSVKVRHLLSLAADDVHDDVQRERGQAMHKIVDGSWVLHV